jgi:NodT family efflux transporter outer membrane factor (OMF) lipoprotein
VPLRVESRRCRRALLVIGAMATVCAHGCLPMVGPDYQRPPAPTAEEWIEEADPAIQPKPGNYAEWWRVFDDPVLDSLVRTAYAQNRSLRIAGIRVLQARAARGIAIGLLYPQEQGATAGYTRFGLSTNIANQGPPLPIDAAYGIVETGFDAAWELDLWGRYRRGVEAADAELLATVADYDDVLVSLVGEVAATYVQIRTLQERLAIARSNVDLQRQSADVAEQRFRTGWVSALDVAQARSLLHTTAADIPVLEAQIRQAEAALCTLLGIPPRDLSELLGGPGRIPSSPGEVAVGVPAELLRRRPDVRRAERTLAAQCARIGIARAELFPHFQLIGSFVFEAGDAAKVFQPASLQWFAGPSIRWNILNYGRLTNNVRVQDASFQALIAVYENTVLRAQQDVETAIAGYLGTRDEVEQLQASVVEARQAVDLSDSQYREGTVEFTTVLSTLEALVAQEARLVVKRGTETLELIALYKALGGGWELREGQELVPAEMKEQMRARTWWDDLLDGPATEDTGQTGGTASGEWQPPQW